MNRSFHTTARQRTLSGAALVTATLLLVGLPTETEARPIESIISTPTATIILDTSGGMEFTPCDLLPSGDPDPDCPIAGPPICACVNPPPEFVASGECDAFWGAQGVAYGDPGFPQVGPSGGFDENLYRPYMTRHHIAMEAVAGTMRNYFCAWDYRDPLTEGPTGDLRSDVANPSRPQGIPHARACSYVRPPDLGGGESSEAYLDAFCGRGLGTAAAPGIQFENDGLIPQNRDLVHFGFGTLDSFQEAADGPTGMWSYACEPGSVWPRGVALPGFPHPDISQRTCLGLRNTTAPEGALRIPVLSNSEAAATAQVADIRESLRSIVPYWATPLAAALHDVRHMYTFESTFIDDDEKECRPNNVILISDSVPTYSRRFSGILEDLCDVFPDLDGCENYWYPALETAARDLFESTIAGSNELNVLADDVTYPVNLYNIAFALNAEETEISERELLSSFSAQSEELGTPFLLDANNLEELRSALGTVLSSVLDGHVVSRTAPAVTTSTRNFFVGRSDDLTVPMSRFEAFTQINPYSPFWGGSVDRVDWVCEYDEDDGFTLVPPEDSLEPIAWRAADRVEDDFGADVTQRRVLTNGPYERCVEQDPWTTAERSPLISPTGPMAFHVPDLFTDDAIGHSLLPEDLQAACDIGGGGGTGDPCDVTSIGGARRLPAFSSAAQDNMSCLMPLDPSSITLNELSPCTIQAFGVIYNDLPDGSGSGGALVDCTAGDDFDQAVTFLQQLMLFIRGATIEELLAAYPDNPPPYPSDPTEFDPNINDRPSRFGSVLYSSPLVVPPPSAALPFEGLQDEDEGLLNEEIADEGFALGTDDPAPRTARARPTMVYVGSDAGVLHAINGQTGEEAWAFYPSTLLRQARNQIRARQPMVDGTPVAKDMRMFRGSIEDGDGATRVVDRWRTVLVFGLRQGGRGYVALDVTDPYDPRFLWQYDARNDPAMGFSYGKAALATVRLADCSHFPSSNTVAGMPAYMTDAPLEGPCERGVVILPGGVHPDGLQSQPEAGSNVGRLLVVVDAITGTVIQRITTVNEAGATAGSTCNLDIGRCVNPADPAPEVCHSSSESPYPQCDPGYECVDDSTTTVVDPGQCRAEEPNGDTGRCIQQSEAAAFPSCTVTLAQLTGTWLDSCGGGASCRPLIEDQTSLLALTLNGRCMSNTAFNDLSPTCTSSDDCDAVTTATYESGLCAPAGSVPCMQQGDCEQNFSGIPSAISGSVLAFDTFAANLATRAFVGDEMGRLLRLDMSSPEPMNWRIEVFFDPLTAAAEYDEIPSGDTDLANPEPVFFEPTVAYLGNLDRAVILYGQGDLNRLEGASSSSGRVNHVFSLLERPRFSADGRLLPATAEINWILRLAEPGERLTARPRIFNNVAYFATYIPNPDNACEVGNPRLYGIEYAGPRDREESYTRLVSLTTPGGGLLGLEDTDAGATQAVIGRIPSAACVDDPEEAYVFFCDSPEEPDEDALIQPRRIINALDFIQAPSCFLQAGIDGQGADEVGLPGADGQAGDYQLVISQSAAAPEGEADRSATAGTQIVDGILEQPDSPALPTSWGLVLPW